MIITESNDSALTPAQAGSGEQQPAQSQQQVDAPQGEDMPAWGLKLAQQLAEMIDKKIGVATQATPAPQEHHKDQPSDVETIVARRLAFAEAIRDLPSGAQEKLRGLYDNEKPRDVHAWVNSYVDAFGLKKGANAMIGNNNGTAPPVTGGGVPKLDKQVTNYHKGLQDLSADEVADIVRAKGIIAAGREFKKRAMVELQGVTLSGSTRKG